jgi:hypothetical protein
MVAYSLSIVALMSLAYLSGQNAYGAACCGARASMPNLIVGDYRWQGNISWINGAVAKQASDDGQISKRQGNNQEVQETMALSAAYLLTDLWQINGAVPVRKNSKKTINLNEEHTALGDANFGISYEFLPEVYYAPWKPRGFIFLTQNVPTGKSTFESSSRLGTDATGKGYASTALGIVLLKNWGQYDGLLTAEFHRGWKERFDSSQNSLAINPRYGYSTQVGVGVSPYQGDWRIGGTLAYSYEAGHLVTQAAQETKTSAKYLWDTGINLSYLLGNSSLLAGYSDQTLLGAKNTNLNRSLNLSWQYFYER